MKQVHEEGPPKTDESEVFCSPRETAGSAKRVFLAIDLPEEMRNKVADLSVRLQKAAHFTPLRANWVPPANFHITLHFLGPVPRDRIERICDGLGNATSLTSSLRLSLARIGYFPDEKAPKVLWAGLGGEFRTLLGLRNDLGRLVESCGVSLQHQNFHGHVTLARFKSLRGTGAFVKTATSYGAWKGGEFDVEGVTLFESVFTSEDGVQYLPLRRSPLGSGRDSTG